MLSGAHGAVVKHVCSALRRRALRNSFQRGFATDVSQLKVGDTFVTEEKWDREKVAMFVSVTGDANSAHADPDDEGSNLQGEVRMGNAIIPGSLCASMFPAIIGTAFPGALYLTQTLKFRNPAAVGMKVRAEVTVEKISGRRIVFDTVCRLVNPSEAFLADRGIPDIVVVDGKATALLQGWKLENDDTST